MSCAFDKEMLTGYFDGELDPTERSEVERHISTCSECLRDLGEVKSAALLVRELPRHRAPRSIAESVSREIAAAGSVARFRVLRGTLLWATAAAAALLIAVNVIYFTRLEKAAEPLSAVRAPASSAAPALAAKTLDRDEEAGKKSFGKADGWDRAVNRKDAAPREAAQDGVRDETYRRASQKAEGNALRGNREGAPLAKGEPEAPAPAAVPPPAPSAPPPVAKPGSDMGLKTVNGAARKVYLEEEQKEPAEALKKEAGATEKAKKTEDDKRDANLALIQEKVQKGAEARKAAEEFPAGGQAGGGGLKSVALTLAAADPAEARSKVEAILLKLGVRTEPPAPLGTAARSLDPGTRARASSPLAVDLTEKQFADFRREVEKEKALVMVEGRGPGARKQMEEMRAKAAPKPVAAAPGAVAGEERKVRETTGGVDKVDKAEQAPPPEAQTKDAGRSEALLRQQAEPVVFRVTFGFTVLEAPPAEQK